MSDPRDAPLGAKPVLPSPKSLARAEGTRLFQQVLGLTRGEQGAEPKAADRPTVGAPASGSFDTDLEADVGFGLGADDSAGEALPWPGPESFPGGRRYDAALAVVEGLCPSKALPESEPESEPESGLDCEPTPESNLAESRPPPGAPAIRPSVPAPELQGPRHVPDGLLESAADAAMLVRGDDGSNAFDISFRDELFENLTCRISTGPKGVIATFRVTDANTRRLFEGEADRLRSNLEERGLRDVEVRVIEGEGSSDR